MDITKIPMIMRKKGWLLGALMMETWLSRPARVANALVPSSHSQPCITFNTEYALSFPAAKKAFNQMLSEGAWQNQAARDQLKKRITDPKVFPAFVGNQTRRFCDFSVSSTYLLEDKYINSRPVYSDRSPFNDLLAGLGDFNLRMAMTADIKPAKTPNRYQVTPREIGVYIVDSYNFNDDLLPSLVPVFSQPFGFWSEEKMDVGSGDFVNNKVFRDWRKAHGKGGDFMIYSRIYKIPMCPATFEV